jgi:hypothetical protein
MSILTVILKDSERTFRKKYLMYVPYTADLTDPEVKRCVDDSISEFDGEVDSVQVKIAITK